MPDLDDSWGIWKNIERGNIISALLQYEKDKKKRQKTLNPQPSFLVPHPTGLYFVFVLQI